MNSISSVLIVTEHVNPLFSQSKSLTKKLYQVILFKKEEIKMIQINTKEFLHNFAKYKEKAKAGERIVVCEHKKPILDIIPHDEKIEKLGWKRDHYILPNDGHSLTDTLTKERQESRY